MNVSPDLIESLYYNEVFVFGSNEAGIHGAGAARLAMDMFGANYGQGFGFSKNNKTFAIPTKDVNIETLDVETIKKYIKFFEFSASENPNYNFLVTEIGCGLAGYTPKDIAPLFTVAYTLPNVYMPKRFWEIHNARN